MSEGLAPVHDRLRAMLAPYRDRLHVDESLFRELEALTALSIERQPAMTEAALKAKPRR